eukprot:4137904-Ditylum_brightwellii.AAC.1
MVIIPAGMEIFAGYGYKKFKDREDKYGPVPMQHHYLDAGNKLEDFWKEVDTDIVDGDKAKQSYDNTRDSIKEPQVKMLMTETFEKAKEVRCISSARLSVPDAV